MLGRRTLLACMVVAVSGLASISVIGSERDGPELAALSAAAKGDLQYLQQKANDGDAWAQYQLGGEMLVKVLNEEDPKTNIEQAARLFLKSAKQGNRPAARCVSHLATSACLPKELAAELKDFADNWKRQVEKPSSAEIG